MNRSGYSEDCEDNWAMIKWRGQVASAIRGKRGQAFLREMIAALDALPEKKLISHELAAFWDAPAFIPPGLAAPSVCAVGSVGLRRGLDMSRLDADNSHEVAEAFGVARPLVAEIEWENDWMGPQAETPEHRWQRMRDWAVMQLKEISA